jgi:hypothetical protein
MHSCDLLTFLGLVVASSCQAPTRAAPTSGPAADISALASRAFLGRRSGTPGGDSAAAFVMGRFATLQLRPAFRIGCDSAVQCGWSYVQVFPFQGTVGQNVAAFVDGTDSTMRTEYIVIGAHFDGQSAENAFDPQHGFMMRPGADDNASGTAGMLALARRFSNRPIRRSILFVGFDAEEEGLCGSRAFVANPPIPRRALALMVNLDMIGHLHRNRVLVEGVGEQSASRPIAERSALEVGLRPDFIADRELSDHVSFRIRGVEVASLSTGDNPDYHTTNDVAGHVDMSGVDRVIGFAEAFVRRWDAGRASPPRMDESQASEAAFGVASSDPSRAASSDRCS